MEAIVASIFNELSISPLAINKDLAKERMEIFVKTCIEAQKIGFSPLRYTCNILEVGLSEDYTMGQWKDDSEIDRDLRTKWKTIVTAAPFLRDDEEGLKEILGEQIYHINEEPAEGLGIAALKRTLSISLCSDEKWNATSIILQNYKNQDNTIIEKHAARPSHITSSELEFKFHTKHGKCGKNEEKGQNIMYCCDEKEAKVLLNTALPHPNRQNWLCNYDEKNKRFLVFPKTNPNQKEYHGFHYENEKHKDTDRDLNGKNGIPKDFQIYLQQRQNN